MGPVKGRAKSSPATAEKEKPKRHVSPATRGSSRGPGQSPLGQGKSRRPSQFVIYSKSTRTPQVRSYHTLQ